MKKILCLLVAFLTLGLCACGQSNRQAAYEHSPEPPMFSFFHYNSVDELIDDIENRFTEEFIRLVGEVDGPLGGGDNAIGLRIFVSHVENNQLYVPYHNGEGMELANRQGWGNITLNPGGGFILGRPTINYRLNYEKTGIMGITIMYLDSNIKERAEEESGSWLYKQFVPLFDINAEKKPNSLSSYDTTLALAEFDVNALISTGGPPESTSFIRFAYNDVYVQISTRPDSLSKAEDFLRHLSFEKIDVKKKRITDEVRELTELLLRGETDKDATGLARLKREVLRGGHHSN